MKDKIPNQQKQKVENLGKKDLSLEERSLVCLWCGKKTTICEDEEHIFPECIGGKLTLYRGAVCSPCNGGFSEIDKALKYEHPLMLDAFQIDKRIKGKIRGKEDTERKLRERVSISGIGAIRDTKIEREGISTNLINVSLEVASNNFVRSLHKCVANILCAKYGSIYVRKYCKELLDFVKNGGDTLPWSYAVSKASFFQRPLIPNPFIVTITEIRSSTQKAFVISFLHTSGIWVAGSLPFLLNPSLIQTISDKIIKKLESYRDPEYQRPLTDFFGCKALTNNREYIGKLKFLWVVKETEGVPDENNYHLLTKCKVCGQTNPTGIMLGKNMILNEYIGKGIGFTQRNQGWNILRKTDLLTLGLKENHLDNPEEYFISGVDEKIKCLKIENCRCYCIKCGNLIDFSTKDCFL